MKCAEASSAFLQKTREHEQEMMLRDAKLAHESDVYFAKRMHTMQAQSLLQESEI